MTLFFIKSEAFSTFFLYILFQRQWRGDEVSDEGMEPNGTLLNIIRYHGNNPNQGRNVTRARMLKGFSECALMMRQPAVRGVHYRQWAANELLCIFMNCQRLNVESRHILSRSARKLEQSQSLPHFVRLPAAIVWPPDHCANL